MADLPDINDSAFQFFRYLHVRIAGAAAYNTKNEVALVRAAQRNCPVLFAGEGQGAASLAVTAPNIGKKYTAHPTLSSGFSMLLAVVPTAKDLSHEGCAASNPGGAIH